MIINKNLYFLWDFRKEVCGMRKFKETAKKFVVKYGAAIATCAFAFVAISANTSCGLPYFEPEEPKSLENYKRFNK